MSFAVHALRALALSPRTAGAAALLVAGLTAGPLAAQRAGTCFTFWETLGAPHLDLDRVAALAGESPPRTEALYRSGEAMLRLCDPLAPDRAMRVAWRGLEAGVLPVAVIGQHNSAYPKLQRDGLRWAGRGLSGAATFGAVARWGPVTAAVAPVFSWQGNAEFEIEPLQTPGLSEFGSYYHAGSIDAPQRFGDDAFSRSHPGQSYVRVDAYGVAAGISTETLRWGPARRNPLLMSGGAPGFLHGFLGTGRPVDVGIGRLEVEAIWGRLEESQYFDTIPDNDRRLLAGLVVAFSPGEDTGLTIGGARSYLRYIPPGGLPLDELIFGPYGNVRENADVVGSGADNQLLSAFFRWAFPAVGFEVYGEYARDDHWEDFQDLVMEPDHSRAFTAGLQKVFTLADRRRVRVAAEATNLNSSPTWQSGRPQVAFYTHATVRQGYTHEGQILGAPIGVGSDAQYVAADYITDRAVVGLHVERVRYDNDTYYTFFAFPHTYSGHDAELTVALRGAAFMAGFQATAEAGYSHRWNRGFIGLPGTLTTSDVDGFSLALGVAWVPGAGRSAP